MILIAKNPQVEDQDEEDAQRHLNIVKNKLSGWHVYTRVRLFTLRGTSMRDLFGFKLKQKPVVKDTLVCHINAIQNNQ